MDAIFPISHSFSLSQCQARCEEDCQFFLSHASQSDSFFFSLNLLCHHGLDLRALLTETHEYSLYLPNYYACCCCPITASVSV